MACVWTVRLRAQLRSDSPFLFTSDPVRLSRDGRGGGAAVGQRGSLLRGRGPQRSPRLAQQELGQFRQPHGQHRRGWSRWGRTPFEPVEHLHLVWGFTAPNGTTPQCRQTMQLSM